MKPTDKKPTQTQDPKRDQQQRDQQQRQQQNPQRGQSPGQTQGQPARHGEPDKNKGKKF